MAVLVVMALLRLALTRHVTETAVEGSWLRMIALPVVMLAAVFAFPTLGFAATAVVLGLALTVIAQHDLYSVRSWAILLMSVTGVIVACTLLFSEVLSVPLP